VPVRLFGEARRLAAGTVVAGSHRVHVPAAVDGLADLGAVGRLASKPEEGLLGVFVEGIAGNGQPVTGAGLGERSGLLTRGAQAGGKRTTKVGACKTAR
jgi:hypothetical protein